MKEYLKLFFSWLGSKFVTGNLINIIKITAFLESFNKLKRTFNKLDSGKGSFKDSKMAGNMLKRKRGVAEL